MQRVWWAYQNSYNVKILCRSRIVATFKLELGKPVQSVYHLHLKLSATTFNNIYHQPFHLKYLQNPYLMDSCKLTADVAGLQHLQSDSSAALSTKQFQSSTLCSCEPTDLEFAARQSSWPTTQSRHFKRQLKTYFFAKHWWQNVFSALEIFPSMRYINLHFTYLLIYLLI